MDCPYLDGRGTERLCVASITGISPLEHGFGAYCLTGEYWRCALYISHLMRGGRRKTTAGVELGMEK